MQPRIAKIRKIFVGGASRKGRFGICKESFEDANIDVTTGLKRWVDFSPKTCTWTLAPGIRISTILLRINNKKTMKKLSSVLESVTVGIKKPDLINGVLFRTLRHTRGPRSMVLFYCMVRSVSSRFSCVDVIKKW